MSALLCGCNVGGFRRSRIGIAVVVMIDSGPYKMWMADELTCPNCGAVVYETADNPIAHWYNDPTFLDLADEYFRKGELVVIGPGREEFLFQIEHRVAAQDEQAQQEEGDDGVRGLAPCYELGIPIDADGGA